MKKLLVYFLSLLIYMDMNSMQIIDTVSPDRIDEIQEFYNNVGYNNKVSISDKIVIALDNNKIVGVVRLCYEEGEFVLRGMQVLPTHQRQGLGTTLIKKLDQFIGSHVCWCIPYGWLEKFYNQIGFKKIDETKAPLFLQERIKNNRKRWPDLIMMVKNLE